MEFQDKLLKTLTEFLKCIDNGGDANEDGIGVAQYLEQIEYLRQQLGEQTPPMLVHYLDKRSYVKAIEFLEGKDGTLVPNC